MSRLHAKQVRGKYYVDNDVCLFCGACVLEAPRHFAVDDLGYVFRQPGTAEEEENCRRALLACPMEAVCDDGEGSGAGSVALSSASPAVVLRHREKPAFFEDYGDPSVNWRQRITIALLVLAIFAFLTLTTWAFSYIID